MSLAILCVLLVFGGCTAYPGENEDGFDIQVGESEQERSQLRIASCSSPITLGLSSEDIIPDEAFTASSYTDFCGAHTARLNLEQFGPWVPDITDTTPWIQVDLGESRRGVVTGVQTQGSTQDKRVTAFKVKTGMELSLCTQYITEATGTPKVFSSSTAATTTHNFPHPVEARFVRIEPTAWAEYGALRFEVLGCPVLPQCATGWDAFVDGPCFKFAHTARVTYTQADAACQSEGAKLATIHSEREQFFISGDLECYTASDGSNYRGHVSTAKNGYNCQKWTSQYPRSHTRTPENYPDGGLGDHNYCRNPDGEPATWCYTTDGDRWEYCDVGTRQDFCFASKLQKDSSTADVGYFVGLNDMQTENVFQWKDGTPYDYYNWATGQPDNYGVDENCVAVWPQQDGKWKDDQCTKQFPYICEKRREIPLFDRTATQSSTAAPASRAIDGRTSTTFSDNSCSQTSSESGPWWMVDQVFNQCVGSIVIYNRQDCCKETLVGAIVRVGDNSNRDSNPACDSPISTGQVNEGSTVEVPCNLRGRYISISLTGMKQLTLCEVKAYLGKCDSGVDVPISFTSAVCTSPAALGMADNQIADSMITTSTLYSDKYLPKYARLDGSGSWESRNSDNYPWIQVDLFGSTDNAVSGLITQGAPSYDMWVSKYTVKLGDLECSLQYIVGSNGKPKVFPANSDRNTKVTNMFPSTVRARYVRICLTDWKNYASMRLEVLGCRL